jgi:hypothetical protein
MASGPTEQQEGTFPEASDGGMATTLVVRQSDIMTDRQADIMTDRQADIMTDGQADKRTSTQASGQADKPESTEQKPKTKKRSGGDDLDELLKQRLAKALELAQSPTVTVTLRIPIELNRWLDEYVHRAWPERVRKQELVAEALRMLFARRGRPGEPTLATIRLQEGA